MLWILLFAFGALVALHLLKKFKRLEAPKKKKVWIETLFLVGAVVAVLVLARFGMHWIGLLIAGAWAGLRTVAPLLMRLLPMLQRERPGERGQPSERAPAGGTAADPGAPRPKPRPNELMSRAEALDVLGVEEGASRETILVAYRNLIRKVHPDSPGGSNYLASKINQARDVLLS